MMRNKLSQAVVFMLLLAVALPAMAAPKNNKEVSGSAVVKGTFNLSFERSLSGTTLKPGEYQVIVTDSQVSFLRNKRVVAQASIQWKDTQFNSDNAIVDESGSIREIRFKGKKQSAVVM